MTDTTGNCQHLEGLRALGGTRYLCPGCGSEMDPEGISRWVREAEAGRDEAYSLVEGDGFDETIREELQREVYRRRKVMYGLHSTPRVETARPEMLLVSHEPESGRYECRIFYKEPRPEHAPGSAGVAADLAEILEMRTDSSLVLRLVAEKVEEFHVVRTRLISEDEPAPGRRVFYAHEL